MGDSRCLAGCLAAIIAPIVLIIMFVSLFFTIFPSPPLPDNAWMEEDFQENKDLLVIVRDYLVELGYTYNTNSIQVSYAMLDGWFDGTVFVGLEHGRVPIANQTALDAIHLLFENGYRVINLSNNHIRFQRWSNRHQGRGALYMTEGTVPYTRSPTEITILEPLSEEGWFFYVSQ